MAEPRRGRPREFDEERALDAAMTVFWARGYEATSVGQLCEAMGIARQSMYDWVGDKRALFLAALDRYRSLHVCGLSERLSADGSALANLRSCLRAMSDAARSPSCKGCLLTNTENEFGDRDPEIARATRAMESSVVRAFEDVLERAKAAGEIGPGVDCRAVASALAILRNGLMVAGRAGLSGEMIDHAVGVMELMLEAG